MCLVRVHLEHGGGEEAGHGGVLLLHADLKLVDVVVADALAGVVREADERSALAVAGPVGRPPRHRRALSCFRLLYSRTTAATASLVRPRH